MTIKTKNKATVIAATAIIAGAGAFGNAPRAEARGGVGKDLFYAGVAENLAAGVIGLVQAARGVATEPPATYAYTGNAMPGFATGAPGYLGPYYGSGRFPQGSYVIPSSGTGAPGYLGPYYGSGRFPQGSYVIPSSGTGAPGYLGPNYGRYTGNNCPTTKPVTVYVNDKPLNVGTRPLYIVVNVKAGTGIAPKVAAPSPADIIKPALRSESPTVSESKGSSWLADIGFATAIGVGVAWIITELRRNRNKQDGRGAATIN